MSQVKPPGTAEPLPRYVMPDKSEPPYEYILAELEKQRKSEIGSAYYYIKCDEEWFALCRITPGKGRVFFHEVIDHHSHGISDDDIRESVLHDRGTFSLKGHYHISPRVEMKLRVLFDTG